MINSQQMMTNRGWVVDQNVQPPGFFYPNAGRPHLHLSTGFNGNMNPPWLVTHLQYTDAHGMGTPLYQNNQQIIGNLQLIPLQYRAEAQFVLSIAP
jgi:hypothetical protein